MNYSLIINFKLLALLLVASFGTDSLLAIDQLLEVQATSARSVESEPGKVLTATFLIVNHTGEDLEVVDAVRMPAGWQKIAPTDAPFLIGTGGTSVRVMAIRVPQEAIAGDFNLDYIAQRRGDPSIATQESISVRILPVDKLELVLEDRPDMVVAGREYTARYRLINRGNAEARITFQVKSDQSFPVVLEPSEIVLPPGSSEKLRVRITTEIVPKRTSQIVSVQAIRAAGSAKAAAASHSFSIEVIPMQAVVPDMYHRMPVEISVAGIADTAGQAGIQGQIGGGGAMDENGRHRVDFNFRGPDAQGRTLFGQREEYWISYAQPNWDLHMGDRAFHLSRLTESHAYGRGIEANYHPSQTGAVGAFYMQQVGTLTEQVTLGAHADYIMSPGMSVRGNFLNRQGSDIFGRSPGSVYSIEPQVRIWSGSELKMEYAISDSERAGIGHAARAELRGELWDEVFYSLERVDAGSDFTGALRATDSTQASVSFPIRGTLRGQVVYSDSQGKVLPLSTVANSEQSIRPGVRYRLPFGTDLSLDFQHLQREDKLAPALYDFEENSVRVGAGHSFGKLGLQAAVETGQIEDHLRQHATTLQRYTTSLYYRPAENQSYNVFLRAGHGSATALPEWSQSYGISANWQLTKNAALNLQYERSELKARGSAIDSVQTSATYTFANQSTIAIQGRALAARPVGTEEAAIMVSYTIPLNVPMWKRKDIAVLRGKVFDAEKGRTFPVPDVILRLNDHAAISDNHGNFTFPDLKPGTYTLQIEQKSIGMNRVTTEKMPAIVEVKKGSITVVDIGLITAAQVTVRLAARAPKQENPTGAGAANHLALRPPDGHGDGSPIQNATVQITNGNETLRAVTDRNGVVTFGQLAPTGWSISVLEESLPEQRYLEEPNIRVHLNAGEKKQMEVSVLAKLRTIRLIDQGTLK